MGLSARLPSGNRGGRGTQKLLQNDAVSTTARRKASYVAIEVARFQAARAPKCLLFFLPPFSFIPFLGYRACLIVIVRQNAPGMYTPRSSHGVKTLRPS